MNISKIIVLLVSMLCMVFGSSETRNGSDTSLARVKRGHGGGGGHGKKKNHYFKIKDESKMLGFLKIKGHGPGRGGGAAGPIYFCGYVGKTSNILNLKINGFYGH